MPDATPSLAAQVDGARIKRRISQVEVARQLGVSQGHYSKVVSGEVPLTDRLADLMRQWLADHPEQFVVNDLELRMRTLAAKVKSQCDELLHLAAAVVAAKSKAG